MQGLFIKRQLEVARSFADVIADRVLNSDNLIQHLSEGPSREPVMRIVEEQVEASWQLYERDAMVAMLVSKEKIAEANIHAQLEKNLLGLDSEEFGGVLRPVFQKDEWKLVLAGGVIGTIIGALQVVFLFGGF